MSIPLSNRPKITDRDISNGYVTRYFVKFVSHNKITEIDELQYPNFVNKVLYQSLEIQWLIGGTDVDTVSTTGEVIRGTKYKNQVTIDFYNKQMHGLRVMLRDPLEYFIGTRKDLTNQM